MQRFLRATAANGREVIQIAPFSIYLDPKDPLKSLNYAVPDDDAVASPDEIERLREEFLTRGRLPRLEWIEECAPRIAAALEAAGMAEELRTPLMSCDADGLLEPSADVADLTVREVSDETRRDATNLQRVAFGEPPLAADEEPRASSAGTLIAYAGEEPVAAGSWTRVIDGVSEVAGIATAERWRRRGLAGVVTAACTRAAFEAGASLCVLSPGDDTAQRVYERAGYRGIATMLHWSDDSD